MKKDFQKLTVEIPKGKLTRSESIDGFQIINLKKFNEIKSISNEIKTTSHKLYFDLIIVITKGEGIHTIDFRTYTYTPGTIFIIKKGQFHSWDNNSSKDGYLLFFTKDFYGKMGLSIEDSPVIQTNLSHLSPILNLNNTINPYLPLLDLISTQYLLKIGQNKVLKNLVQSFLSIVEMEYFKSCPQLKKINSVDFFQKFNSILETQTPLPSRNAEFYANHFNISFKTINNTCKKINNYTVKAYIDMVLITRAKRALVINSQNVSQIAFDLSFEEVGNFSKFFKKKTGLTPNQFRKSQNTL